MKLTLSGPTVGAALLCLQLCQGTVLADSGNAALPPVFMPAPQGCCAAAQGAPLAADVSALAGVHVVQAGETLDRILQRELGVAGAALVQARQRTVANNPQAFVREDPNRLRAGSTLRLAPPRDAGMPPTPAVAAPPARAGIYYYGR